MLRIKKDGLSANAMLQIKKISSMYNPEFFKKLSNLQSIYKTPRVLSEFEEDEDDIAIPRGLKDRLYESFINIQYTDHTVEGEDIEVAFKGTLKKEQHQAANSMLEKSIGILEAVTGFGKTVTALYLIASIQKSTLVIVNNKELLKQWKNEMDEFLEYPKLGKRKTYYGEYHGNKKKLTGKIDFATIQSLANIENKEVFKQYGLVIIDECHHASSDTYRTVLKQINSKYMYSFSATPERKDQLEPIMKMYLGNILYKTDHQQMIENREFDTILNPRFTTFNLVDDSIPYTQIIDKLIQNEKRNYLIVKDIEKEIKEEKNIIVLSDRKDHLQLLYKQLQYFEYPIYIIHGDIKSKERDEIIHSILTNEHYLLLATSSLLGEGFNLPSLNTMFITSPISFKGRLTQIVGRLHRNYDFKEYVTVYDYVDVNITRLNNMFHKRLKTYEYEDYKIKNNEEIINLQQRIFNKANYNYYLNTLMNQSKEIIIFASSCNLSRIQRLYASFIGLISAGKKIYICLSKDIKDIQIIEYLQGMTTKLLFTDLTVNSIILDEKILLTSSSSYLGVQNIKLFYIQSSDQDTIDELIGSIQQNQKEQAPR